MKKILLFVLSMVMILSLAACGTDEGTASLPQDSSSISSENEDVSTTEPSSTADTSEPDFSVDESPVISETPEPEESTNRQISVRFGENTVIYELNDGTAANSLYEQLPLTIEVEDYSTNEKIFYPANGLDTSDSPLAQSRAGTLAYYAPWGDVVFFYGDYNENPGLFELGQVVSGGDLISRMSGTIIIEAVQ